MNTVSLTLSHTFRHLTLQLQQADVEDRPDSQDQTTDAGEKSCEDDDDDDEYEYLEFICLICKILGNPCEP